MFGFVKRIVKGDILGVFQSIDIEVYVLVLDWLRKFETVYMRMWSCQLFDKSPYVRST